MKLRFLIIAILILTGSHWTYADTDDRKNDVELTPRNPRPRDNSTSEIILTKLPAVNLDNGQRHDATFLTFNSYSHYIGDEPGNYRIDLYTSAGGAYFGYLTIPRQ